MLSAVSYADAMKDKGLTRKILVFNDLTVSGEVHVVPVFSKLLGLITCKVWLFRQSATQLWPSIFAGLFCSLED